MEEFLAFQQGPLITDIAAHVFSFLPVTDKQSVAKVCRYWRQIVYLPRLWRDVTVELPLDPSNEFIQSLKTRRITRIACLRSKEEDLSSLFSTIPNLTHVNIIGCPQVSETFLVDLVMSLSCLELLAFRRCHQVTNKLLKAIRNPNLTKTLKSFALEDCQYVTHVGFKALVKTFSSLETLDLTWCVKLNNSCLQVLSDSCPKLSSLKIQSCDWVSHSGLVFVAKKLQNIKSLDLKCCHGVDDDAIMLLVGNLDLNILDITGIPNLALTETITYVASKLTRLKSLSFGGSELYFVSDVEEIEEIFQGVSKLQELESFTCDVSEEKYDEKIDLCTLSLLKKLPNLKRLDMGSLTSISDETVIGFADHLPHLEKLSLSSYNVKDNGITALSSKLSQLKVLDLRGCSLTDKGIEEIASKLQKLETLILAWHHDITNAGIKQLINLRSLTSLDLMLCSKVTDTEVGLIALGMPQLMQFNLSDCQKISDQGAIMIGKHLKNLHHLTLESTQVGDEGFVFISQNLPKLQTLAVGNCFISDKALVDGTRSLGNLKEFEIGSCDTTDAGLDEAVHYLKGLTEMTLQLAHCVTVTGIEIIVTGLPNLTHLGIDECKQITPGSVRHLQSIGKAKITVFRG